MVVRREVGGRKRGPELVRIDIQLASVLLGLALKRKPRRGN